MGEIQAITTDVSRKSKAKVEQLYNLDYRKWVVGYETAHGMQYATKQYKGSGKAASKFPLGTKQFNDHFNGLQPIAVFAFGNKSKFFTMDIDTKESARNDAFVIVETLKDLGFTGDDIHVSFSGSKGYHVTLYSDIPLLISDWHKIGDYVRAIGGFDEHQVEYRPAKRNGHAVKLPLTLHPKTKKFAAYCDEFLMMLSPEDSHAYFNEIQPTEAYLIQAILEELPDKPSERAIKPTDAVKVLDERLYQTAEEKTESAIKLLTEGLAAGGTRWKAMRNTLIPYLKCEMGCDEEETRSILYDFCEREYDSGRSKTEPEQSQREVDALIASYYPLVTGVYSVKRDITVSREEIEWVVSVVERGGTRASRDLLWALLLMRKTYGGNNGQFFASRETVQKLLSKPRTISPSTLQKSRDWLAENGYIEFTVPDDSFSKRRATTYKTLFAEPAEITILKQLTFEEDGDARSLLTSITSSLYTKMDIRRLKLR